MPKYTIITDTDSSLPLAMAEEWGIRQVPISIEFGEQSLRDLYDISDSELFVRIDKAGKLPTTAAPSPGAFAETFQAAFDAGADRLIYLAVSSEVSATYKSAQTAADLFPGRDITVHDTRSLSMGQGFMAMAAAKAARAGKSGEEILAAVDSLAPRTHLYAALATLKYLAMSGRVGSLAAGIADILSVKPLLTLRNGKLDLLEKVRVQSKAWARVVELTSQSAGNKRIEQAAILHVNAPQFAKQFETLLRQSVKLPEETMCVGLNPGLCVHTGSGLVGVCIVLAE
jgi:DegV family protein with EDD domain